MDIKKAIQEVDFIKKVLKKTKTDFSLISMFFIEIGIIKFVGEIFKLGGYAILNNMDNISYNMWIGLRSLDVISFIFVLLCYCISFKKLKVYGNNISINILKIWGGLIIIGQIVSKILYYINSELLKLDTQSLYRSQKELEFFLVIIAFMVLGILLSDKVILLCSFFMTLLYFLVLSVNMYFVVGQVHGFNIIQSTGDILSTFLLSLGLIILGGYLKHIGRRV